MKKSLSTLLVCGSVLLTSCASMNSSEPSHVSESARVQTSAENLWKLVGNFNDLDRWHPAVKISRQLSDQRFLELQDGAEIVEQQTARDDAQMSYSYRIVSGPLPVQQYQATISVRAVGSDQSEVTWSSDFRPDGVSSMEAEKVIKGVYQAGFQQLQTMYR